MKLNIYNKKDIVKTYEADTYNLKFGTVEDVANALDLDDIQTGSNDELIKMAAKLVMRSFSTVTDLIKDIFEGITDDEIRNTAVIEIAAVLVDVVKYTIAQLNKGGTGKN